MRGSDADAALHHLARMLEGGEDVRFIARRIVICAAEDVGNADPQALIVANAAAQAAHFVGLPEAQIPLAQAVCYIANALRATAVILVFSMLVRKSGQSIPEFRSTCVMRIILVLSSLATGLDISIRTITQVAGLSSSICRMNW